MDYGCRNSELQISVKYDSPTTVRSVSIVTHFWHDYFLDPTAVKKHYSKLLGDSVDVLVSDTCIAYIAQKRSVD